MSDPTPGVMRRTGYPRAVLSAADIAAAARRLAGRVARTPLYESVPLSEAAGRPVWLKCENRQHTGSFKARGALHKLLTLAPAELARGIVAASAGNHALGIAWACTQVGGARGEVFVQRNASPAKIAKLRRYGIALELVGDTFEEAQQAALARARITGATFVSAYDDAVVAAGQGTVGEEIVAELPVPPEAVVVPTGGGALLGGVAVAVKASWPDARVIGVNPSASPSALLSLREGRALDPFEHEPTRAHGLAGGFGKTGFALAQRWVDGIELVTEAEMDCATAALIDAEQMIAEPSGIAAVAAVLAGKIGGTGPVVAVISGGNVDSATLAEILTAARPR